MNTGRYLLSGNEAVARGAFEAGITFASGYPGTPSTEIIETIVGDQTDIQCYWSVNEKTALEEALGASFVGARTLVTMKHVGLNVAADPLFSAGYIGVTGGMVIISADDPGMHSSQNEQDNRHYGIAAKIPVLEPADSQEAKDLVAEAIRISEYFDTPVLMRMTTRVCHSKSLVELGERMQTPEVGYRPDMAKRNLLPVNARVRHQKVEARLDQLAQFSNDFKFNYIVEGQTRIGVVASGVCYQYGREVFPEAWFLKVTMVHPFPERLLIEFCQNVDLIYVLEENDPLIENTIRRLVPGKQVVGKDRLPRTGELSPDVIRNAVESPVYKRVFDSSVLPKRPPSLCPGCSHRSVFYLLNELKVMVSGDIGCYSLGALAPLNSMDTAVAMGGSITTQLGMEKALQKAGQKLKQVAVIGDSTFLHSGMTGLVDAFHHQGQAPVIILDNSITAMTGHQVNPGTGINIRGESAPKVDLYKLIRDGLGIEETYQVDAYDVNAIRTTLTKALESSRLSVIIVKRRCVLSYKKVKWSPLAVNVKACRKCKACLKLGCSAIDSTGETITILAGVCIGCGVCAQICPFQAIEFPEVAGAAYIKDRKE